MFVRSCNPIWYMVDYSTGLPLNDQYYAFFLANDLPYLPQNVFQDENGISPWDNPIQFQSSGTLPNNLYFNPDLVYRIAIRRGPDSTSPLIWLIENYVPSIGGTSPSSNFENSQNLIIDPQFADISFSSPVTFVSAGTYNIAPNWQLILTGSGSSTLTQKLLPGNDNLPGNPPYALEINNSGWTTAKLVQTFNNNGAIFAGGAVAMSILAKTATNPYLTTLNYVANGTPNNPPIATETAAVGVYTLISGFKNIGASSNISSGAAANVQMTITLPTNDIFSITNVAFIGQTGQAENVPSPVFQEQSYPQIVNNEFYVYRSPTVNQPKNSILTGWNFGNNPWQFTTTSSTNVAANQYTADQTIVLQQNYISNISNTNNVAVGQDTVVNGYGFKTTAVTVHNQFALLQWIDPSSCRQFWGNIVSSMVKGFLSTVNNTAISIKMRLIYTTDAQGLPNTTSQLDPIASWVETSLPSNTISDPVAAAGYVLITPPNDPVYPLTGTSSQFQFNGIQLPASPNNANATLGILIYTIGDMSITGTPDSVTFNDISLVQNAFALPTQPETFDETLRKCQYYYEKSYDQGQIAGVSTSTDGLLLSNQNVQVVGGPHTQLLPVSFGFEFFTAKRSTAPTIILYSQTNASNAVQGNIISTASSTAVKQQDIASSSWSQLDLGQKGVNYVVNTNSATLCQTNTSVATPQAYILYHYTVNACLANPTLP